MVTHILPTARAASTGLAGTITLALGILFTMAVALAFPLSLRESFNPPDWVRVVGLVWLPIGLGGVPIGYAFARNGPGRARARAGVLVALVGLVAFVALVISIG